MKPIIVLPTYNERENLKPLIAEILSVLKTHIIVVDDHSPDGTGELAKQLAREHPAISVIHRSGKFGLGSAYLAGFRWALERDYDPIIQMDADFSHDPHALPKLITEIGEADIVLGSRYVDGGGIRNWPFYRQWISAFGSWYARTILGLKIRDLTGGYKVFKRQVLESLDFSQMLSDGYVFEIESTFRAIQKGYKVKEVPIIFKDRTRGKSKISKKVIWEAMWLVWKLKRQRRGTERRGKVVEW